MLDQTQSIWEYKVIYLSCSLSLCLSSVLLFLSIILLYIVSSILYCNKNKPHIKVRHLLALVALIVFWFDYFCRINGLFLVVLVLCCEDFLFCVFTRWPEQYPPALCTSWRLCTLQLHTQSGRGEKQTGLRRKTRLFQTYCVLPYRLLVSWRSAAGVYALF